MRNERGRFTTRLARLPGCEVFPSQANFVFVELPRQWRASAVAAQLRPEGLLIRDCSSVPGLNAHSIRVAVRTRRENDRLVTALSKLLVHR
jgi:threonine-phosphate decarboxylase